MTCPHKLSKLAINMLVVLFELTNDGTYLTMLREEAGKNEH